MISISLCMIVKDEEAVIGRCLNSVKEIVDEIIIVDTGSTDKTKQIASLYTDNIYDFKWIDDFSAARNYSFSKATKDYIFWLDADDVLLEADIEKLIRIKKILDPSIDVVMMKYNLGLRKNGKPTLTFYRERLLKRSKNYIWYGFIHEYLDFKGKIVNCDVCITHKKEVLKSSRNLNIFEKKISEGYKLDDRNYFYYARELYFNEKYDKAMIYYEKFLETNGGYLSNYIDSCIDLSKCYKMKDNKEMALRMLFRSFEYDLPRGEVCTYIGLLFKEMEEYKKAIYWFETVTNLKKPENSWGSIIHDMWEFIPCIELSICYFNLGNIEEAIKYNNMAAKYKPDHPVIEKNRKFLKDILSNSNK